MIPGQNKPTCNTTSVKRKMAASKENIPPSLSHSSSGKPGRKRVVNNPNENCRLCKKNLRIVYGPNASCINLFKTSERKEAPATAIDFGLGKIGIVLVKSPSRSEVVCRPCGRKLWKLLELYKNVSSALKDDDEVADNTSVRSERPQGTAANQKRNVTPGNSPFNRKTKRIHSPAKSSDSRSRSRLFGAAMEDAILSQLNVDDLPLDETFQSSQIKVVIAYSSGHTTVKSKFDEECKTIITNFCLSNWQTAANAFIKHRELSSELIKVVKREASAEFARYSQFDSCLKVTSPDQLAKFSNRTLLHEVSFQCPIYSAVVQGACNMDKTGEGTHGEETAINAIALATSALARARNPQMSAVAYRVSIILSHSGVSYRDITRLNHLGVCMSHKRIIDLHCKMGDNSDYKLKIWKEAIETNKSCLLFLQEINEKQIPKKDDDDMDIEIHLDLREEMIKKYRWFNPKIFTEGLEILEAEKERSGELAITDDVLKAAIERLKKEKLPLYK